MESSSVTELLPNGVGRVPAWWMECTPHYTLDVDDEEARQIAEDQVAFFYMMLAAADDAGIIGTDGKLKTGPDGKPLAWEGLGPNWNSNGAQFGGRTFKSGQAVIDPSLFGIKESDPNYNAYLTGAKLPPRYFEKMAELVEERSSAGNPYGILNNSKQTDYGRYGRQAEQKAFQPSWAKKKLRSTTQGQAVRGGVYDDSPNKFLDINGKNRRVQAKEFVHDETNEPAGVISSETEPIMASASSVPAPTKSIPVSNVSSAPAPTKSMPVSNGIPSVTPFAQPPVETPVETPVEVPERPPSPPSPQPERRVSVTMARKVRQVRLVDDPVDSMVTNAAHLLKSQEEAIAVATAADDEDRLRELQAEKERMLKHQQRLAEETKQKAAEARQKQVEKMQQLQMQAAAEEAEAERKRQEAALVLKKQKEAELQRLREQQAQQSRSHVAESAPIDPLIAEKLRRLEELKELKRQQELAEAASAAGTEEYDEETFVEEEVEEEEVTVGDEDDEYTVEEETYVEQTYVEDSSINDLQAILAAKQAELAKLQGM